MTVELSDFMFRADKKATIKMARLLVGLDL